MLRYTLSCYFSVIPAMSEVGNLYAVRVHICLVFTYQHCYPWWNDRLIVNEWENPSNQDILSCFSQVATFELWLSNRKWNCLAPDADFYCIHCYALRCSFCTNCSVAWRLISPLVGGDWSVSRSNHSDPGKRPASHCGWGWVDPGAGLDIFYMTCYEFYLTDKSKIMRV
jgi:hypothetical protein